MALIHSLHQPSIVQNQLLKIFKAWPDYSMEVSMSPRMKVKESEKLIYEHIESSLPALELSSNAVKFNTHGVVRIH